MKLPGRDLHLPHRASFRTHHGVTLPEALEPLLQQILFEITLDCRSASPRNRVLLPGFRYEHFARSQLFDCPDDNTQTTTWYRSVAAVWEED